MFTSERVIPVAIVVFAMFLQASIHKIHEGHVGVYYIGGRLLDAYTEAGYNVMFPFFTRVHEMQITIQTDEVTNIPCGTRGGVMITFEKVEVVNILDKNRVIQTVRNYGIDYDKIWIFDKIHHEINQFCSQHTLQDVYIEKFDTVDDRIKEALQRDCNTYDTGIRIIAVRVTKPKIPEIVRRNYEEMEAQKTQYMIAVEHQKVVEKQAETERRRLQIEAETAASVASIRKQQEIMEQEAAKNVSRIKDEMHIAREKAYADAEHYKLQQEAIANSKLLTKEYLELKRVQAISNLSKIYFGNSIPAMFSPLDLSNTNNKK
ncbi:hypothetical protein GUITHDRAFT_159367 [Guillardia theta CCMP2712]|uniref:Band 7 domain-containing protein n=3 Tax=Guillardia theta TaxID=55529 RepID=L1JPY7_GUITC|nr:hypothetical protein GUITHDRAFT_159367 [Guillardia theta CCMP2712]EKX50527.1 hypothetical protein GUITHDRAFT_159367 [Guillardia theta CCMP2712]|eukprot:XP_005837507.1 hypothetical protein GUITHDRAFT_159367 [Guillardia theta CCMP2712]